MINLHTDEIVASAPHDEASFGFPVIIGTIVLIAGGTLILYRWRDFWSGRKTVPSFLLGERGAKVAKSVFPYISIPILCFGLFLLVSGVSVSTTGWIETVTFIATVVLSVVLIVSWTLLGTIALFNRPRFLVPPYMRDFDGYLGDLIRHFADRRRWH